MTYTADYLINCRKTKWNSSQNIEFDNKFRKAVANELLKNRDLLDEVKKNPEKLIQLFFVVVNKEQRTVPFFFNNIQEDFILRLKKAINDYNNGTIRDISLLVLKGRQLGFTTLITAYQLACTILNKNFQGFTVADDKSNTEAIFQNKAKFPYNQLPEILQPTEKFNSKNELLFEKLNSSWAINTATKNMGRSRTINFLHGSECAFWKDGIAITQAGLGEALTKNCIKIYESTANGFNDFQKMWKSKRYINCFYEWWLTSEYRISFETDEIKQEFINNINTKDEWIYTRLRWLRDIKKLDLEQLYWYYNKFQDYIDKELIKQEYPCTPEEAFLNTGKCYFDKEKIILRLAELEGTKPLKVGYFDYIEKVEKAKDGSEYITIENIKFVDDPNGCVQIYEDVKDKEPYVIGGDTAGDGSDYFTGHVINNITGKQVAKLKQKFNEVEYTKQIYCLGMYYNTALIGLETNFSTYPTNKLDELKYPKLYIRKKEDEYTEKLEKRLGFKTTSITRPLILANLQAIILEEIEKIVDIETLEECLSFIKNEKGRPEAEQGEHDDLVMALAITYYIREQQIFKKIENYSNNRNMVRDDFAVKTNVYSRDDDFGSYIEVI